MIRAAGLIAVGVLVAARAASAGEPRVLRAGSDAELARAVADVQPGDTILVADGTYREPLVVRASGKGPQRVISVRAEHPRKAVFSRRGQAALVAGSFLRFEGLVFDSQYENCSCVRAYGKNLHFLGCEIRRAGITGGTGGGDGLQFYDAADCLVEKCHIHHCLASKAGERVDSHGVRVTHSHCVTVRGCVIALVSGDCLQADPNRRSWDDVLVEDCRLSGGPVPADDPYPHPGFAAGSYPAENAVDTKCPGGAERPRVAVRNCEAHGFRGISNAAAFNIKEACEAVIDRCTIYDCDLGLRLRGPSHVRMTNCVLYDNDTHCRYENGIPRLHVTHCTFGRATGKGRGMFQEQRPSPDLRVRGCLFLGETPAQAHDRTNRAVGATAFADAAKGDYRLAAPAPVGGKGPVADDPGVKVDRAGAARPADAVPDAGAYQFRPEHAREK